MLAGSLLACPLGAAREITLEALPQGCAGAGVCDTPQRSAARLQLAALEGEAGGASDTGGVLSRLRKLTAEPEPEFLPVDQAFKVSVRARDAHTLVAEFVPAKGYYLYRDKLGVAPGADSGVAVKSLTLPRGEIKNDPNFGDTEVFHTPVQVVVALERKRAGEQRIGVETNFQGCAEAGLCYPPERKRFDVVLAAFDAGGTQARSVAAAAGGPGVAEQPPAPEPAAAVRRVAVCRGCARR